MIADRLQLQRREFKYIIPEDLALEIRKFVEAYLELDEYGATLENLSYPVHSLYLDSDILTTYWDTINGNKNRYKLRLRFYENRPNAPIYFEIKRRMNDAMLKQRGPVKREKVAAILGGQFPSPDDMASSEVKHLGAVQNFVLLMNDISATVKAHVAYNREAWISSSNNAIRVTMDRSVRCAPVSEARFVADMVNPVYPFGNHVVLELKFTGRFPEWFMDMVRAFGLVQCSAAKYADGIAAGGERRFTLHDASRSEDSVAQGSFIDRKKFLEKYQTSESLVTTKRT